MNKHFINYRKTYYLMYFFLMFTACSQTPPLVCEKSGVMYCRPSGIFVGKWFDYYARALSCMEGECYTAALSDLDNAIFVRSEDERMVRTYGMHFIDYFPHREKGLIYFIKEDYDLAKIELERSLNSEPSAKAYFYLNETRKKILERDHLPISNPVLMLDMIDSEIWTNDDPIILSGTAQDSRYVSEIIIRDMARPSFQQRVFMEVSSQTLSFREKLAFDQGRYDIIITAKNLLGGQTEKQVVIHADRKGPVIIIEDILPGSRIKGAAIDESGITSVDVNGNPVSMVKGNKVVHFEEPIADNRMMVQAEDRAGNQTRALIEDLLFFDTKVDGIAWAELISDTNLPSLPSDGPEIIVNGLRDHETVFLESVMIEGSVKSSRNIANVTVNREAVLNYPGKLIFFNHTVKLKEGGNRLIISATDDAGQKSSTEIFITRKIPEPFQLKHRYCFSVYPFDYADQVAHSKTFHFHFFNSIVETKRFQIIVRDNLKKTLNDFESVQSNAFVSPRGMMFGSMYQSIHGIEIIAEITDKKSETHEFIDSYILSGTESDMEAAGKELSEKLHRKFPLMVGTVNRIASDTAIVTPASWTPEKGDIQMRWPIVAFHKNSTDSDRRGADSSVIGESFITHAASDYLGIDIIHGIQPGDGVITR